MSILMGKGTWCPVTLRRTAFWCGAGMAAFLGAAALAVALAVYRPQLLLPLVRRALVPAGGSASLGGVSVVLNPPAVTLSGLAIRGRPQEGDVLELDRLRVEWDPARLVRGGPRWRRVEVSGLVFERPRPLESKEPPDLTPLSRLFDIEYLSVDDARLRLALSQGILAVDGLRLNLAPGVGGIRGVSGDGHLTLRRDGSVVAAGRIAANGKVTPGPAIDLALELQSARLDLSRVSGDLSGRAVLRVSRKHLRADDLRLTLLRGRLMTGPQGSEELGPVLLNAAGSMTLEGKEPRLEVHELDVGGRILARGWMSGPTLGELSATADGEIPRVERVTALTAPLFPGLLSGIGLEGRLRFRANLDAKTGPATDGPRLGVTVAVERIGFSLAAGDVMVRDLTGRLDLEAQLGPRARLKVDLATSRGEALWGTMYVDLSRHFLDIHAGGRRRAPGVYEELILDGGLAGLGRLAIEGNARREAGSWRHQGRLALSDVQLGPCFRIFLQDPLVSSHAGLAKLRMGGTARMDLAFSGSGRAVDLEGRLRVRSGDLHREGEPPVFSGLDIDLPVAYSVGVPDPGGPVPSRPRGWGRLRLKELRLAGQRLGPLEIPVVLAPNRLYVGGSITAPLFGGSLLLQRIRVDEPFSPRFRIHLAARLDGLDLARIAGEDSRLEGRVGGLLDPVLFGRDRLTASGELAGELFGGRMEIRRVSVERPFGPGREFASDVYVSLLDLERLSAAFGAGRITGRLSGSLEGFRMAYGQPVAFHLKAESIPVNGVNQSVSLRAVDSISLVSTGSSLSGPGSSIMTRFFRDFPYAKIGVECRLENDVFTVRGLIHEDGVEYLVKRRLFAGINVINRNPDNRIGFSDMLERARRATGERSP